MIFPPYMTITRLQTLAITPRSWVIRMVAVENRSFSSAISSMICA